MTAPSAVATGMALESDRQVDALATTGLPALLDLSKAGFRARLEPLRDLLPGLGVPDAPHVLVDVDPGPDPLGATPADVAAEPATRGRTPPTVAEGLSVLVSDPGVLRSRNGFALPGSRSGDERVPPCG